MWSAMEDRLHNLDLWLSIHDSVEARGLAPYDGDTEYDMDSALRWITGIGANGEHWEEGITIEHVPSLAQVRSLTPEPAYSNPEDMLFDYVGFARHDNEAGA